MGALDDLRILPGEAGLEQMQAEPQAVERRAQIMQALSNRLARVVQRRRSVLQAHDLPDATRDDVAEFDKETRITVVASYEDGVHVLRPVGLPIEVTRARDGDDMIWTYLGFTARLRATMPR